MNNMKEQITLTSAVLLVIGSTIGVDAMVFEETQLQKTFDRTQEIVEIRQVENVVEVDLPWQGEDGFTIKYDMGEPTLKERLDDKRTKYVIVENVSTSSFEVDIVLTEKPNTNIFCYTIEGAENYNFFRQPPLWEEYGLPEATRECTATECDTNGDGIKDKLRPDDIVGSYAIYHKTLRDNEYQTGKHSHIPYPYIWSMDATSTTYHRAKAFTIEAGQMCITVDQKFLDSAQYPVRVDPVVGYTSAGLSDDLVNTDSYIMIPRVFPGAGQITKYSIGARVTTLPMSAVFGLFSSSSPYTFIGSGSETLTFASSPSRLWSNTNATSGAPTTVAGESYLITAYINGNEGGSMNIGYDTVAGASSLSKTSGLTYPAWTATSGTPGIDVFYVTDKQYAIYVDYQATDPGEYTEWYRTSGYHEWTAPTGVSTAWVSCIGGGGGGGDGTGAGGCGGGGGAFASSTVSVTEGTKYTIYVGPGGNRASAAAGKGSIGATSTFATTTLAAAGGDGGKGASSVNCTAVTNGGLATYSTGDTKYNGGNGGGGLNTGDVSGGGGAAGGPNGAGSNGAAGSGGVGGAGGSNTANSCAGGTGGNLTNGGNGNGTGISGTGCGGGGGDDTFAGGNGSLYGGGGGGGENNNVDSTRGNGASGTCLVTYVIPTPAPPSGTSVFEDFWFFN